MDDHPPNFVAMIGSTPDASNRLANVWRNVWGVTFESPARWQALRNPRTEVYGEPLGFTNTYSSRRGR